MTARPPPRIAALVLEPFPLWLAERTYGPDFPLAVTDAGRVLHANAHAQQGSVQAGMRVSGALSRLPNLHTVPLSGPAVEAGWAEVAALLPAYSPRLEVLGMGRALLTLTQAGATELAAALNARTGLADTRELALLAALNAASGQVNAVQDAPTFRRSLPLDTLMGVGLSPDLHERLTWLGVQTVGDLLNWSKAQQAAYLGAEFTILKPYLHGANTGSVQRVTLPPEISARLDFSEPLYQPYELEAAAAELALTLLAALDGRTPHHLSVKAGMAGVTLTATRTLKEDVRTAPPLQRALLRTLQDADAAQYGIETLEVTLTHLTRPAVQGDLFSRHAAREAAQNAESRYPGCMSRVQWLDPHSLATDTAYQWVSTHTHKRTKDASSPSEPAPVPAALEARRRPKWTETETPIPVSA